MPAILRLHEDTLAADGSLDASLPAMPRMVFVVHGAATIDGRTFGDGEAWFGEGQLAPPSAASGAAAGRGVVSHEKLAVALDGMPAGDLLLRGDSVAFPPGGCA